VVTLRNFYTAEITPRAKKAGMELGYDFRHVRLLSRFPFPHRAADSKLDTFQSQALAALEKDPKTPVHSVEDINGRLSVRYAVADVMKEGCVACHNSHATQERSDEVGRLFGSRSTKARPCRAFFMAHATARRSGTQRCKVRLKPVRSAPKFKVCVESRRTTVARAPVRPSTRG